MMRMKNVMSVAKKSKNLKKTMVKKKKKDLSKVSTDEFFQQDFENGSNSEDNDEDDKNDTGEEVERDDESVSGESDLDPAEHKKSLKKLKDTDPEFYSYLRQNDKNLLNFKMDDDDDDEDDDDDDDESDARHILIDKLEVASDESDYEGDQESGVAKDTRKITLQMLKTWQEDISRNNSLKIIKCTVDAFHAALQTVTESGERESSKFIVEGGAVFNGVVQLCILHLPEAFKRFLKLDSQSHFQVHKCKRFGKIKGVIKSYLTDLIKILQNVTSSSILTILLKHLHQMLPFAQSFSALTKPVLRILIKLWSTGEETVRVVAFLNILRIASNHQGSVLDTLLKTMYVKYVENAKFVSPTTLPAINFMEHSLNEIYMLDNSLSYSHAFLYIRQLAIHLRNAMTLKKKENFQAVYNWQYINSLRFWTKLINSSKSDSMLRSLLYPLVQIIIGTIKVIPTPQYYPLRFHCVQMLINVSKETDTFIPILPFLLEVLNSYDFDKKHKTVSMKPVPFICILRMSKTQLLENGFKDNIIDSIYKLVLENAAIESHKIYFPDLYIPCIIQLKAFLKKCHVANYCRKIKQLLEKIETNRKFIETERNKTVIDLKNLSEIKNWENKIKTEGTAIAKFYASWVKIHQSQKLKLLTKNEDVAEYNLPVLRKTKKSQLTAEASDEASDEESDSELLVRKGEETKKKTTNKPYKPKKKKMKTTKKAVDIDLPTENTDIVQDINSEDWN